MNRRWTDKITPFAVAIYTVVWAAIGFFTGLLYDWNC